MTTQLLPYNWLRTISPDLKNFADIPLAGYPPPFNWQNCAKELSQIFNLENLEVTNEAWEVKPPETFLTGFEACRTFTFSLSPLEKEVFLLIPDPLLNQLIASMSGVDPLHYFVEKEFNEGFNQFLQLELASIIQKLLPDPSLALHPLTYKVDLPNKPAHVINIKLSSPKVSGWVRLIVPEDLRQSWKEKYNTKTLTVAPSLYDKIYLTVHVEAGKKRMTAARWKNIRKGDYVILDSCSIVPGEDKGRVMLTINRLPYFRAKIKDGSIKILEYPLFYEAGTNMAKEIPQGDADHEEFVDEELTEDFTEDDEELEGLEGLEDKKEGIGGAEPQAAAPAETQAAAPAVGEKTFKADDIALDIIVEVGRFQMTIQKLTELKPGNLLDLNVRPENGVDLVVNGVCIAKGELLKIGETLGVRILDIA